MAGDILGDLRSAGSQVSGDFRSFLDRPGAITAAAHKLARIIYHMLKTREPYDEGVFARLEVRYRQRVENRLKAQAHALGFSLVPTPSHA